MIKYFLSAVMMTVISTSSFSQTTQQKVEQAKNDPKATESAAKADVKVAENKTLADKATLKQAFANTKPQKIKSKRKRKVTTSAS